MLCLRKWRKASGVIVAGVWKARSRELEGKVEKEVL